MSGTLTQFSLNRLTVGSQTCAYVASKDDPGSWHGTDSSEFGLDRDPKYGRYGLFDGLGISEWRCPHPPLGEEDGDERFCVFHTETEVSANSQRKELLKALEEAGEGPRDDRPEHRGQFVGATFGAINLSNETIRATNDYGIRFDHARFQAENDDLKFRDTSFETQGQYPVSFFRAEFITDGDGYVSFDKATFRTKGNGNVVFNRATFRTTGDGNLRFANATFRTTGDGNGGVDFIGATFRAHGDGILLFREAKFIADGVGGVWFDHAIFRTNDGEVWFRKARFITNNDGNVNFGGTTFVINGDGA